MRKKVVSIMKNLHFPCRTCNGAQLMKSYLNVNTFLWEVFKFYEYHKYDRFEKNLWKIYFGLTVPCIQGRRHEF